jgi:hypothetical protein
MALPRTAHKRMAGCAVCSAQALAAGRRRCLQALAAGAAARCAALGALDAAAALALLRAALATGATWHVAANKAAVRGGTRSSRAGSVCVGVRASARRSSC